LAARRLIAILLVLLFLSSLAAALAPVQRTGKSASTTTTTEGSTTQAIPGPPMLPSATAGVAPRLLQQSVDASRDRAPTIKARVGDQLQLRVTSRTPGTVELVGIGPTEDVGAQQPAFFDVLLRKGGSYRVRFLDTGREIALIEVANPKAQAPPR